MHSVNAPEKVIKMLSRMGISVACSTIHRAVHSLSCASHINIWKLAQTRLTAIAYDNFDIKFNTLSQTLDAPGDGLVHLTSATMLQLDHGATVEDLQCSNLIWNRQDLRLNPLATDPRPFDPLRIMDYLCRLHPEPFDPAKLSRCGTYSSNWRLMGGSRRRTSPK